MKSSAAPAPPITQMDFRPVPPEERESPGRVMSAPARLYIDKWVEHREACRFLQQQQDLYGDGSRLLVRALIHYRDNVIIPLERWREQQATKRGPAVIPPELLVAQLAFRPVPPGARENPGRIKSVSARLYIDKYIEHREAYEMLQEQQALRGEGLKTLIRALLYYRDTVVYPLPPGVKRPISPGVVNTGKPQLEMDLR